MRVAVVTTSRSRIGGAETYVEKVLGMLADAGHDVALFHEFPALPERPAIRLPAGVAEFDASALGAEASVAALRDWRPTVLYQHGLSDPTLEAALAELAPTVMFAHNYYGTCVSGSKTYSFPTMRPCHRVFGPGCLALYYLRRTGGLSPVTMVRQYGLQSTRLGLARSFPALLTFSEHMRAEYIRHGVSADGVHCVPYPIAASATLSAAAAAPPRGPARPDPDGAIRLLFIGRMEPAKGARLLLESLPAVRAALGRPVRLTMAGEGPERAELERAAARLAADSDVAVSFVGWIEPTRRAELLDATDLLVVPSVWPEPFGIVGLEAALAGVPAVAFDVGGVRSWLTDGRSGVLAPGEPPTADGLAAAIVRASADPRRLAELGATALRDAARFSDERHLQELLSLLERVAVREDVAAHAAARAASAPARREGRPTASNAPTSRPQRVLLVSFVGDHPWSGMGKWSYRVADGLRRLGHEPTLWFEENFPRVKKSGRFAVLVFPMVLAARLLRMRRQFDVVVIHEPAGFWYAVVRRVARLLPPMVAMCHNVESKIFRRMLEAERAGFAFVSRGTRLRTRLFRNWQSDGAVRMADEVICLSSEDRRYIAERIGRTDGVTLMLNGADAESFGGERTDDRAGDRGGRVLFVGGWHEVKGRYVLPKLWRRVRESMPSARLSVVGSGAPADAVLAEFDPADRDSVRVVPRVEDLAAMMAEYRAHDVFLMPSLNEGSPLSLLEAMAAGCAIAAANVGGIPDLAHSEEQALLYPGLEPARGAEAVLRLLGDPALRRRLGDAARMRARNLNWGATADTLAEVVARVARGAARRTTPTAPSRAPRPASGQSQRE